MTVNSGRIRPRSRPFPALLLGRRTPCAIRNAICGGRCARFLFRAAGSGNGWLQTSVTRAGRSRAAVDAIVRDHDLRIRGLDAGLATGGRGLRSAVLGCVVPVLRLLGGAGGAGCGAVDAGVVWVVRWVRGAGAVRCGGRTGGGCPSRCVDGAVCSGAGIRVVGLPPPFLWSSSTWPCMGCRTG
jgi:hypothetical protein